MHNVQSQPWRKSTALHTLKQLLWLQVSILVRVRALVCITLSVITSFSTSEHLHQLHNQYPNLVGPSFTSDYTLDGEGEQDLIGGPFATVKSGVSISPARTPTWKDDNALLEKKLGRLKVGEGDSTKLLACK